MEQKRSKFSTWLRNSITARMMVVGFLLLILLIPLEFVKSLIAERAYRQKEVISEINSKWGNEVLLSGPTLQIPYKVYKDIKTYDEQLKKYIVTQDVIIQNAYFFPEELTIDSQVDTKPLNRSIYKSVVFTADLAVKGSFPEIDFTNYNIKNEDVLWNKASVFIETSNLKGIKNTLQIKLGKKELKMSSQYSEKTLNTIKSDTPFDYREIAEERADFSFDIKVNGSESLKFIPIANKTSVKMESNWHSPGFDGEFLPEDHSKVISQEGFKAAWNIFQLNRQFEQSFFGELPYLSSFAFGTNFIIPVDEYQKTERTSKYGFMVIGLTLLVFLMIQISSKIYIHPFQYVMIGLALVMFYTLLIAVSEHSSFLKAYLIAGASVLGLITLYSKSILKGFKFPLLVCFSLSALYGFIYVIIQLEHYALLTGSIGMFLILAIIMFTSRKIDWDNQG